MNALLKTLTAVTLALLPAGTAWAGGRTPTAASAAEKVSFPEPVRVAHHTCTDNVMSCYSSCLNSDWAKRVGVDQCDRLFEPHERFR